MIGSFFASSELSESLTPSLTPVILSPGTAKTLAVESGFAAGRDANFFDFSRSVRRHSVEFADLRAISTEYRRSDLELIGSHTFGRRGRIAFFLCRLSGQFVRGRGRLRLERSNLRIVVRRYRGSRVFRGLRAL